VQSFASVRFSGALIQSSLPHIRGGRKACCCDPGSSGLTPVSDCRRRSQRADEKLAVSMAAVDLSAMDSQSFVLSDIENASVFEKVIIPKELAAALASRASDGQSKDGHGREPLAILLLGQTGAGKSYLAPVIHESMQKVQRGPTVWLVADKYKTYHPDFDRLAYEYGRPDMAYRATTRDARIWLQKAVEETARHGNDLLVESACRHSEDVRDMLRSLTSAGYRRYVVFLAVHDGVSRLGLLARYYTAVAKQTAVTAGKEVPRARRTPVIVHDESYRGCLQVAKNLDDDQDARMRSSAAGNAIGQGATVDRVVIVRRNGVVAYDNWRGYAQDELRWLHVPQAAETLSGVRDHPLDDAERLAILADISVIRQAGGEAASQEYASIDAKLKQVLDARKQPSKLSRVAAQEDDIPYIRPSTPRTLFDVMAREGTTERRKLP
jgi:hypothetical protein